MALEFPPKNDASQFKRNRWDQCHIVAPGTHHSILSCRQTPVIHKSDDVDVCGSLDQSIFSLGSIFLPATVVNGRGSITIVYIVFFHWMNLRFSFRSISNWYPKKTTKANTNSQTNFHIFLWRHAAAALVLLFRALFPLFRYSTALAQLSPNYTLLRTILCH